MTDIAVLGLAIDSSQVVTAKQNLSALAPAAQTAQTAFQGVSSAAATVATATAGITAATAPAVAALKSHASAHAGLNNVLGIGTTQMMALTHSARGMAEMLAMGVSPTRVLMMEMGHLSYGLMGPEGLIAATASARAALLAWVATPTGMLTAGLAAAGVAALAFYEVFSSHGPDATRILKEHEQAVKDIKAAWDDAQGSSLAYGRAAVGVAAQIDRQRLNDLLNSQQSDLASRLRGGNFGGIQGASPEVDWGPLQAAVDRFNKAVAAGQGNVIALRNEVDKIAHDSPGSIDIGLVESLHKASDAAAITTAKLKELNAVQREMSQKLVGTTVTKNRDQWNSDFADASALQSLRNQLNAMNKLTADERAAAALQKQFATTMKDARIQVDALNAQADMFGASAGAIARYVEQQKLTNAAVEAGIKLTPTQIQRIKDVADAYGLATDRLQHLKDVQTAQAAVATDSFNALWSWASGANTAADAFRNLAKSIEQSLLQAAALGTGPFAGIMGTTSQSGGFLGSLIGALTGMGRSGSGLASGSLFHGGYGPGDAITSRLVHPAYFDDAPRFHGGIGPGEMPAIIRQDESVLTPGQLKALGQRGSGSVTVPVQIDVHNAPAGTSATASQTGGGIKVDIYVDDVAASKVIGGESKLNRALERRYGLVPQL